MNHSWINALGIAIMADMVFATIALIIWIVSLTSTETANFLCFIVFFILITTAFVKFIWMIEDNK